MANHFIACCGSLAAALAISGQVPVWGQRVQFPSMVQNGSGTRSPVAPPASSTAPPATGTYPSAAPAASSPPATFGGTVQSAPTWDPYASSPTATPGSTPYYVSPQPGNPGQPPYLFPEGMPWGSTSTPYPYQQPGALGTARRLLQETHLEGTWLAPNGGSEKFGMSTLELYSTFALPMFYNTETPLLVTPGFAVNWLTGPLSPADLPPRVYDTYLDLAWRPQVSPWLAADLGFRTGIYSDFDNVSSDSLRFMGRGLGIITMTPTTKISLGLVYLDRIPIKMLPAGGVIWTPTPDRRFEIVFPNPKLAWRMIDVGTTEWWWYLAGEYGGDRWTVQRVVPTGTVKDDIGYNDIRVMAGLEWTALSGMNGFFEVGYVFDREIRFQLPPNKLKPKETVMLRAGLSF